MNDFEVSSNVYICGALLSFSIGICFREQIGKIQNGHLSWSIWIALGLYLLFGVSVAIQHRMFVYAAPQDFVYIVRVGYIGIFSATFMFSALTYHTSYRALLLLMPQKQQLLWIVATAVTLLELALNLTDGILFNLNMERTYGIVPDPTEQKTSISLIVYVIATDTIFFVASQAQIIAVMGTLNKVKVSAGLYVEAVFRCLCYSGAVLLFFTTAGGIFFPTTKAWCFMVVPPSIMLTVLLTDCDRVRKLVAEMQGTSTYKSSNISTGIKSTASKVV